ncbi:hypothetical protein NQ315_014451 [Exocentrus adspersus]|uniref:DUF4817 domain-containing protein n=1 Tax=Exocentrus adspersus TaxID=1586481 RepID=A0AAV8V6G1_9CUCU|nr:hypothetical protein NQ315_014451 [Exocentrus adspersus]
MNEDERPIDTGIYRQYTGLFKVKMIPIPSTPGRSQMHLSERERITFLMIGGYGGRIRSYEEAANLFNDTFPNRPPIAKSTVQKTVRRFEQFGFNKNKPRTGRPKSATNEEKNVEVMQSFIENKYISIPKAAQEHGISTFSQLTEDDFDRRVEFCDVIMQKCDQNIHFPRKIVFSAEVTFYVNGTLNRHNCRNWSDSNPHWIIDTHTQTPEKVNV